MSRLSVCVELREHMISYVQPTGKQKARSLYSFHVLEDLTCKQKYV